MAFLSFASTPTALFAIDDDVIPVEGLQVRLESEGQIVRPARSGRLRTAITSENPFRRVWSVRTSILDITDVEALEAILAAPGPLDINGVRIETNPTSMLLRGETTRDEDNGFEARVSFELAEVERIS